MPSVGAHEERWEPFRHDGDRRGVLVVHGFTGTPFEVRPLAEELARRGLTVVAPALAGHTGRVLDLAGTTWPDWYRSVEEAFDGLRVRTDKVVVCGLSLGGLLTLELARRRREEVAAIVVMASPLWLKPWMTSGIRRLGAVSFLAARVLPKLFGSDVKDPSMRRANPATRGMPIRALNSLLDVMEHVRARLPEVDRPALLIHSKNDHTAPFECLGELYARLASVEKEKVELTDSYHLVTLDVERDAVCRRIADFVEAHSR